MEFNLAAKGRASEVKAALKKQAAAIAKDADETTSRCAGIVADALSKYVDERDEQDPNEAISVSAMVRGFAI